MNTVAQRHQAVVEMNVLNDIGVFYRDVIVAEVPEAADTKPVELVAQLFDRLSGDTESSHGRFLLSTKASSSVMSETSRFRCGFRF